MDLLRALPTSYPPLEAREPLPPYLIPLALALTIIPFLSPLKTLRVVATLPILLLVAASCPFYTAGSPPVDYASAPPFLGSVLAYFDFLVLCPAEGNDVRYLGARNSAATYTDAQGIVRLAGKGEEDHATILSKIIWALRLTTSPRGIGWNWQVKDVPTNPDLHASRWVAVRRHAIRAVVAYAQKLGVLYVLGVAKYLLAEGEGVTGNRLVSVLVGLCVWSWEYFELNSMYSVAAAMSIAAGACEPWEWPPIFGPISEAWSVRQFWGVFWHQMLRRKVQQPAIRLARFLGLRRGTFSSKYTQLYVAFFLSTLLHQWSIFNTARADVGEFRFFMSQAVIITLEDFLQHCWRGISGRKRSDELGGFERSVGYVWTFGWMCWCLPPLMLGFIEAGTVGGSPESEWAIKQGTNHAQEWPWIHGRRLFETHRSLRLRREDGFLDDR